MNKRQKKKKEKAKFGAFPKLSHRVARNTPRLLHEWEIAQKRVFERVAKCIYCRNTWRCEEMYDKTMREIEHCKGFEAVLMRKRLELMRECAEIGE